MSTHAVNSRSFLSAGLAAAFALLGSVAASAVCPVGAYVVDLKTGTVAPPLPLSVVSFSASSCPATLKAALVSFNLVGTTCTKVVAIVEYEGKPTGWTVNFGDSPTNDGFGGDGGTTDHDAELWILEQTLAVASDSFNPGVDNPILRQDLALTDGALKLVVKDQAVSWGQPSGSLQTPLSKRLFALPDNDGATAAAEKGSKVYLGLNRVITGAPARLGCGARRALIYFQ